MKNYKKNLIKLYKDSFDDSLEFIDYFFKTVYKKANVVSFFKDGICISALHLVPKKIRYQNKIINCPYIVGAATLENFRTNGYMGSVIKKAFDKLFRRGNVLTALYPFKHSFYEKFGFKTISYSTVFETKAKTADSFYQKTDDAKKLLEIYNSYFKDYDIYIYRDLKFMRLKLNECLVDNGTAFYNDTNYILYSLGTVGEAVVTNPENLNFLDVDNTKVFLPSTKISQTPYVMARIINVKKLLKIIPYTCSDCTVNLKIKDEIIAKNNVNLSLNIVRGKCKVELSKEFDYEISIENFTALIFGSYKNSENFPKKLMEIFPVKKTFLYDQI